MQVYLLILITTYISQCLGDETSYYDQDYENEVVNQPEAASLLGMMLENRILQVLNYYFLFTVVIPINLVYFA